MTDVPTIPAPVLSIRDLRVTYRSREDRVPAVRGISLDLVPGEVLALVGESASGKSTVALTILGLLPDGAEVEGGVTYDGRALGSMHGEELRQLRGNEIAMIFQDALAALTPTKTIGEQVAEVLLAHRPLDKKRAAKEAAEVLRPLLPDADRIMRAYPQQLSGGMAQRVMIAMATALQPRVVIADEPTASLDPAVRQETLAWIDEMRERRTAVLLITHDFGVVSRLADRVAVMYGGTIVEEADVFTIFRRPKHPYTHGLLRSLPTIAARGDLVPMRGSPPDPASLGDQCAFLPRCSKATTQCRLDPAPPLAVPLLPAEATLVEGQRVACYNPMVVDLREERG